MLAKFETQTLGFVMDILVNTLFVYQHSILPNQGMDHSVWMYFCLC